MKKTSTTIELLLYLYNETKMTESVLIQKDIDHNPETEEEFEELKAAVANFNRLLESPSEKCVNRILNYSKTMMQ